MPTGTKATTPARGKVIAAFAAVYLIWGSTYLAIRFAIETLPPFLMAGTRFLLAGGILYAWARARGADRPLRVHWRSALLIGGFLLLGGNGGVVWAEQFVASGPAALIVATVPFWMVLLDWLSTGVRPAAGVLLGLAIGLVGLALLVGPGLAEAGAGVHPVGAGVLVIASLSWAWGSLRSRTIALPRAPLLATAMEMLGGGLLLVVLGLTVGEAGRVDPELFSVRSLLALLYLILFGSLLGFTAYIWLLRVTTPARASTYAYVNPVVAVFLGWALAGEAVTGRTLIAAAIIVGAVALITSARSRTGRPTMQRPETACVREEEAQAASFAEGTGRRGERVEVVRPPSRV